MPNSPINTTKDAYVGNGGLIGSSPYVPFNTISVMADTTGNIDKKADGTDRKGVILGGGYSSKVAPIFPGY